MAVGGKFGAQIDAWAKKVRKRMLAVTQQSVQDVIAEMQRPVSSGGNMPVDTGFLRASLEAKIGVAPSGYKTKTKFTPGSYRLIDAQYTLTIAGMKVGDTLYAVYLANYAAHQEYGTSKMAGRGFVRLAAQQWPAIVARNVAKARSIQ